VFADDGHAIDGDFLATEAERLPHRWADAHAILLRLFARHVVGGKLVDIEAHRVQPRAVADTVQAVALEQAA